jgi:membrane-bound lytic murein transglycosylase D
VKKQIFISIVLFCSLIVNTLRADNIDSIIVVYPETGVEENLDELLNLWYVQQSLQFENTDSLFLIDEDQLFPDFPDSVYIQRLQSLPFVMDLTYNRIVKNFIDMYAKQRRDKVRVMLALTHYYFPYFEEVFDRYNLPHELKYLAVIESALNPRAVSKAGATGLWQFMPATGKSYGLVINSLVDDRRDIVKSTESAALFLRDLYRIYNDWTLVIAAYNCGPGNVNKAIRRAGGKRNYWDIYYHLPRETRGYVPAFIAAAYVMNFTHEHNLAPVKIDFDFYTDTIHIKNKLHLKQVAEVLNVPLQQIRDLNPQYKADIIPGDGKTYHLRIPQIQTMRFLELQDSIFEYKKSVYFNNDNFITNPVSSSSSGSVPILPSDKYTKLTYTVKTGDNLGYISTWYNVRLTDLRYWNNIRQNLIRSGQKLTIYVPNEKAEYYKGIDKLSFAEKQKRAGIAVSQPQTLASMPSDGSSVYYTVKSGDTLWNIANMFPGVSDGAIAKLNDIKAGEKIKPGQVLRIK